MKTIEPCATAPRTRRAREHQNLSLVELAERIVRCSDREALRELHDHRPLFRLRDSLPLLLVDFIDRICSSLWATRFANGNTAILDRARDLTVDKFSNLPDSHAFPTGQRNGGPDCRNYFQTFLDLWAKTTQTAGAAEYMAEEVSAKLLQGRVVRSFRLSCLEARRVVFPARTRYAWRANGGVIYLWMPASMRGQRRRTWLEENIGIPHPSLPEERQRIQTIIDERLGVMAHLPLDARDAGAWQEPGLEYLIEQELRSRSLAEVVANEKADNIRRQRPAIQALGRAALKRLVRRILNDLADGQYEERPIAESFGISTPTLSRFAGHRWHCDTNTPPPDLWTNVAQTVAGHRSFVEIAKETGVWPQLQDMAHRGEKNAPEGEES